MAGGLVALLDDIAVLAKLSAASLDDVSAAVGKAGSKAVGVVIDDTAVTPRYVVGLSPSRELPIIWKIARGSLLNKMLIILPIALLLSAYAPWVITPILMLGGLYLSFEAAEKVLGALLGHGDAHGVEAIESAEELEKRQVSGAIRTDLILSAEIMVIALSELGEMALMNKAIVLTIIALLITAGVYGMVAVIVKMDDVGMHLAGKPSAALQSFGRGLVNAMPLVLSSLSHVGVVAMAWVGGGIILHGLEEFGVNQIPHWVHDTAAHLAGAMPIGNAVGEWILNAMGAAILGCILGGIVAWIFHILPFAKEGNTEKES